MGLFDSASEMEPYVPPSKEGMDEFLKCVGETSKMEKKRKSVKSAGKKKCVEEAATDMCLR